MEYTNNPITITVTGIPCDGEDSASEKAKDFDKSIKELPCKGFAIIAIRDSDEDHIDCSVAIHGVSVGMLSQVFEDSEELSKAARLCSMQGGVGWATWWIGKELSYATWGGFGKNAQNHSTDNICNVTTKISV
jgi:hypothetical protein